MQSELRKVATHQMDNAVWWTNVNWWQCSFKGGNSVARFTIMGRVTRLTFRRGPLWRRGHFHSFGHFLLRSNKKPSPRVEPHHERWRHTLTVSTSAYALVGRKGVALTTSHHLLPFIRNTNGYIAHEKWTQFVQTRTMTQRDHRTSSRCYAPVEEHRLLQPLLTPSPLPRSLALQRYTVPVWMTP